MKSLLFFIMISSHCEVFFDSSFISPQLTNPSLAKIIISAQKTDMQGVVYAGRFTTQHLIVESKLSDDNEIICKFHTPTDTMIAFGKMVPCTHNGLLQIAMFCHNIHGEK